MHRRMGGIATGVYRSVAFSHSWYSIIDFNSGTRVSSILRPSWYGGTVMRRHLASYARNSTRVGMLIRHVRSSIRPHQYGGKVWYRSAWRSETDLTTCSVHVVPGMWLNGIELTGLSPGDTEGRKANLKRQTAASATSVPHVFRTSKSHAVRSKVKRLKRQMAQRHWSNVHRHRPKSNARNHVFRTPCTRNAMACV